MIHLCKLSNRLGGILLALSRLVYLLYKLPNRPDRIFYPLALYCLLYKLPNRPNGIFKLLIPYGLLDCEIRNKSKKLFYPLTLDGSTICNQLGLDDNNKHGMYIQRLIYMPCRFDLQTSWWLATLVSKRSEGKFPWV